MLNESLHLFPHVLCHLFVWFCVWLGLILHFLISQRSFGYAAVCQVWGPIFSHRISAFRKLRFYSSFARHFTSVYGSGPLQQSTRLLSGYVATLPNVVSCTAATRMHIKEYYNAKVEKESEIGSTAGATWLHGNIQAALRYSTLHINRNNSAIFVFISHGNSLF